MRKRSLDQSKLRFTHLERMKGINFPRKRLKDTISQKICTSIPPDIPSRIEFFRDAWNRLLALLVKRFRRHQYRLSLTVTIIVAFSIIRK